MAAGYRRGPRLESLGRPGAGSTFARAAAGVGAGRQREQRLRRLTVALGFEVRLAESLADDEVDPAPARPLDIEAGALVLDRRDRRFLAEPPRLALARSAADRPDAVVRRDPVGADDALDPKALPHRLRGRPARIHRYVLMIELNVLLNPLRFPTEVLQQKEKLVPP